MNKIKKAGIIGGAVAGGLIGGTVGMLGHITKIKFLEELGDNIIDSTILTGEIAGNVASGATNLVVGGVGRSSQKLDEGKEDLRDAFGQVAGNFVNNAKTVIGNSGEMIEGVRTGDGKKILNGAKTLGKIAAIGAITVGAIKLSPDKEEPEKEHKVKE
ncbi:MAG: hypothetical protein PHQ50_04980 [Eubacteriales bacterium]|nr:hypothetical protein [Eubacteriales bacterium]